MTSNCNYHKQDMASIEWLATHFFAKSNDRFKQISNLPINKGDKLIDLCCGPGFYLRYFADLVGPDGLATGVDHDPISLDFAQRYMSGFPFVNWKLIHKKIEDCFDDILAYDVVVIFNAISYFKSPIETIEEITKKMKKGSKLIVKDFDLESIFLTPINYQHLTTLIEHAKKQDEVSNPLKFKNFFGRYVHFLHQEIPVTSYSNNIWSQAMSYPFNQYEIEYIWKNIEALMLQAKASCPAETLSYFERGFTSKKKIFFENKNALFIENEYVSILTV